MSSSFKSQPEKRHTRAEVAREANMPERKLRTAAEAGPAPRSGKVRVIMRQFHDISAFCAVKPTIASASAHGFRLFAVLASLQSVMVR